MMEWSCNACTFINQNHTSKCAICETMRPGTSDATNDSNDICNRKRERPDKPSVQTTLFGKVACQSTKEKSKSNMSKKQKPFDTALEFHEPAQSSIRFVSKTAVTDRGKNEFVFWKECANSNVPFSELKQRTRCAMRSIFGIEKLRLLQPKAVECALKRTSQLVVMATGGGKSLCYQLPALVLGGTTIVISPLIALMVDQVKALQSKGIRAALLSSGNGEKTNREVMEQLLGRHLTEKKKSAVTSKTDIQLEYLTLLYVTPEQVQTTRFRDALVELRKKKQLTLFAVDEAHCLSCWGHDFRKAYMRLDYLRESFSDVPVIACTATATTKVIDDIKNVLQLQNSPCFIGSFDRPNIFYKVLYKDVLDADSIEGSKGSLLHFIQKQHERCSKTNTKCSGIIYCHTRAETTELASTILKSTGIRTEAYHGGLKVHERNMAQQAWTSGLSQVAVATVAFGMGIDLPHVRYVVHWNLAKSPEAFYQESGRAGRDGLPAHSILYYSKADSSKFEFLLSQKKPGGNAPNRELAALDAMVRYCINPGCRRLTLLKHFGEKVGDPKQFCDGSCDFCLNPNRVVKAIEAATAVNDFQHFVKQPTNQFIESKGDFDYDSDSAEYDTEYPERAAGWDINGLGITTTTASDVDNDSPLLTTSQPPAPRFDKVSSMLAKYEAVEIKNAGFVNFKAKVDQKAPSNDIIRVPTHLIPVKSCGNNSHIDIKPKPSSSDFAAEAKRLRDEISKAKADLEARQNNK